jgi:glycosyltransferase involved in cell wall biosynthesis
MTKEWIPGPTRAVISWIVELIENFAARRYDAVVCATPCIYERFIYLNNSVININNYPIANELFIPQGEWSIKEMAVCYVGGIHSLRGIYEMINAIGQTKAKLLLAGNFDSDVERDLSIKIPGWSNVIELGQISRQQVKNVLSRSIAGLVLFHPAPNHINAQPNKMFEYMSAGIPVIASDFPLWKEIIEKNQCGICVNPLDCEAIADAINWIIANPKEAERMGKNGRGAIEQIYNWESESIKLRQLYGSLTT